MTDATPVPAHLAPAFEIDLGVLERARLIRLAIFDVDGVLTDGSLFLGDNGEECKAFHSRDGHGLKMLARNGVDTAVITGRSSHVVEHRCRDVEIKHLHQGAAQKLPVFKDLLKELGLRPEQTAFVGDDIVDLPIMRHVGLSVAVRDAHALVREYAHWITPSMGGRGAARELCELLMYAQGTYATEMMKYL